MPLVSQNLHIFPPSHSLLIGRIVHLVEACVVPATVAFEACGGFERVDHEAVAGAGGDIGGLLGAGTARGDIGHLRYFLAGLRGPGRRGFTWAQMFAV